jgi:hypothetical protein
MVSRVGRQPRLMRSETFCSEPKLYCAGLSFKLDNKVVIVV